MIKKPKLKEIEHKKWERVHEDENSISIWRYDNKKSLTNPYEVETTYKTEKKNYVKK